MHAKQTSIKRTADDPNFTLENKPSSLRQNAVSFVTEEDLLAMRAISQNYEAKASPTRKQQSISTPNPLSDASSEFSRMSDTSVDSQRRMKAVLTSELPLLHSPLRPVKSSSQLFQSKQYLATDENHRAQSVTESNTITFPFRSRQNSIQKDHNSAEALVFDENLTHSIGKKTKTGEVEFETDADTDAGFASKQKDHIVYLNDLNMQMDDLSSDSSFEYFDIVATSAAHEEMFMTSLLDSNMATQIASDMNDLRGKMDETKSLDDYASPKFRLLVDLSDQKLSSAEKLSNLIRMPPEATSTIFGNENVTNKIKYPHSYCPGYMINTTGTSTTSTLTTVTTVTSNHTSPTTLFPKLPLNDIEGNGSMGLLQDRLRNFGPNQKEYSTRFDQSNKPYNSNTIHNNSAGDLIYSTRRSTLHRF